MAAQRGPEGHRGVTASERRRSGAERRAAAAARRARRAEVTDPAIVMEAAASFISVRARSIAETRRRLRHLGYPHELIETALGRLVEVRYLDDASFAEAWVESRDRARPRGESALRRELSLKGIDREVVVRVLEERRRPADGRDQDGGPGPDPDRVAAERLLDRRTAALSREPDPRKRRARAYALLARNGFDPETCRQVSTRWLANRAGTDAGPEDDAAEAADADA